MQARRGFRVAEADGQIERLCFRSVTGFDCHSINLLQHDARGVNLQDVRGYDGQEHWGLRRCTELSTFIEVQLGPAWKRSALQSLSCTKASFQDQHEARAVRGEVPRCCTNAVLLGLSAHLN